MSLEEIKSKFEREELTKPEFIDKMYSVHQVLIDYADYLKQTPVSKIEISDGTISMSVHAIRGPQNINLICLSNDKRTTTFEILNFGEYESADSEMLFEFVMGDQIIFDIGANIGWYTLNFANCLPRGHVYCFEPIPETFSNLEKNISINPFKNITTHNIGLSNTSGEVEFYFNPLESGAASAKNIKEISDIKTITCRIKTLDEFVLENNIKQVDLIKCDVEGGELFVFEGGKKSLAQFRPVVFTEMLRKWSAKFNYHPDEIISLFATLGYSCFIAKHKRLTELVSVSEDTKETNFFFLHREKHLELIMKYR